MPPSIGIVGTVHDPMEAASIATPTCSSSNVQLTVRGTYSPVMRLQVNLKERERFIVSPFTVRRSHPSAAGHAT